MEMSPRAALRGESQIKNQKSVGASVPLRLRRIAEINARRKHAKKGRHMARKQALPLGLSAGPA
jgi:hypothetical protein